MLYLGQGLALEKATSTLHIGQNKTQLKRFVTVGYNQAQKLEKNIQELNPNGEISLIFMQSYGSFLLLDESMYDSLFIQMFVLENYDKSLFEPLIMTPYAKVYKLKR